MSINSVEVHPSGSYRFLPAADPYSSGVVTEPGHRILGVRFENQPPVALAFERIDHEIARRGLESWALVGCQLRSPSQFSYGGFDQFNLTYQTLLAERELLVNGVNPLARTNVVPTADPRCTEPVMAFAFLVVPDADAPGGDFVVAGAGEVDGDLGPDAVVAVDDVTPSGLVAKSDFVLGEMQKRLADLGTSGDHATTINVYTAHVVPDFIPRLTASLGAAARWGYTHWATRPPVVGLEFEMDCSRVSSWVVG